MYTRSIEEYGGAKIVERIGLATLDRRYSKLKGSCVDVADVGYWLCGG